MMRRQLVENSLQSGSSADYRVPAECRDSGLPTSIRTAHGSPSVTSAVSGSPGTAESTLRLSVPAEGIRACDVVLRFPSFDDVDAILPAFTDPKLREAGNLPAFGREELVASLQSYRCSPNRDA